MKSLKYLNRYLQKYSFKIAVGFFFVIVANIAALFPAHLIGKSFNLIISEIKNTQLENVVNYDQLYYLLSVYAGLLILFALMRGVFMFYMRQNIIVVSRHIEYDIKNEIFMHYQNLSSNFYKLFDSGDLLNRITEDVNRVRMYLGPALMYSMNLTTLIILILYRMLMISPQLTLIVLLPLPILSLLIYRVSHRINYKSSLVQNKLSLLTNSVQEAFSGIRLVKSFVREKEIVHDFNNISRDYMNDNISLSKTNSIFFPLVLFLVGFSILLTIYFGGLLLSQGKVTVGEITEFIIYVNMLTWPATSIGWVTEVIQRAAASQTRINEFLNKKDYTNFYIASQKKNSSFQFNNCIEFSDVSYQYSNSSKVAIQSINLHIESNSIIGFVGHVGSGKSTILQILAGLLSPTSGKFYFDKKSSHNFNWDEFRSDMAYVSQNVFLFSDSIRNNILFGLESVEEAKLFEISNNLSILEEIKSFNKGFDTHIGEGGVTLSGGQRQRIALARALLREPKFLILDDALSNVDSETELHILNYLKSLRNTTIILTSNRLSVLSCCDKIFVLQSGELIQQGKHKNLINKIGEYQKLFINQML